MLDKLKVKQTGYTPPPHPRRVTIVIPKVQAVKQPRNIIKPYVNNHSLQLKPLLDSKPLNIHNLRNAPQIQSITIHRTQPAPVIESKKPVIQATPHRLHNIAQPYNPNSKPTRIMSKDNITDKMRLLKDTGRGRILVMIAAGPSVNEVDFTPIKGHDKIDFMCINQPNQQIWPAKYWSFCDHTQYERNRKIWDEYNGIIINSYNVRARKSNQILIQSRPGHGFSLDAPSGYHIGRSTTYASMQLALYLNYDKVFIFGCDMGSVNGKMHYYGQNPDVSNENREKRFAAEAEYYSWASRNLPENVRNKYVFCSTYNRWQFIDFFSRLDHKTATDDILKLANGLLPKEKST